MWPPTSLDIYNDCLELKEWNFIREKKERDHDPFTLVQRGKPWFEHLLVFLKLSILLFLDRLHVHYCLVTSNMSIQHENFKLFYSVILKLIFYGTIAIPSRIFDSLEKGVNCFIVSFSSLCFMVQLLYLQGSLILQKGVWLCTKSVTHIFHSKLKCTIFATTLLFTFLELWSYASLEHLKIL